MFDPPMDNAPPDAKERDVLAGMTRKDAEALVERAEDNRADYEAADIPDGGGDPTEPPDMAHVDACSVVCLPPEEMDGLLALAALGAECMGATEAWAFIPPSGLAGANYLGEMYRSPNGSLLPQANDNPAWARRVLVLEGD